MNEQLLNQILQMLQDQSKDQAVLVNTVDKIDKNVETLSKSVNGGDGVIGLATDVVLLKSKVEGLEKLQEKMADFERSEKIASRSRTVSTIGIVISGLMGLAGLLIGLL